MSSFVLFSILRNLFYLILDYRYKFVKKEISTSKEKILERRTGFGIAKSGSPFTAKKLLHFFGFGVL